MSRISITNETRANIPRVRFAAIKEAVLGADYRLNLVFTAPAKMKKLNTVYRNKTAATDILSFPLSDTEGDMYICLSETRKMAKDFDRPYENFLAFLFIHGCVHLIGHDHSATMERIEEKIRAQFKI